MRHGMGSLVIFGLAAWLGLAGCSTIDARPGPRLQAARTWVLLPVMNYSETPLAGERAEAILADRMRDRGIDLAVYAADDSAAELPELDERRRYEKALGRARERGFVYGITGTVTEWRYRNGLDGEPVVGATLQVVDVASGRVLWSAMGSFTGWGRSSLAGSAQQLFGDLVARLDIG